MAEPNPTPPEQRRSSSQTSASSRRSQKSKTVRSKPVKRLSACSSNNNNAPTDLTSFPSLSPDASPEGFRGEPALNNALSQALIAEETGGQQGGNNLKGSNGGNNGNTSTGNNGRGRQATLAGLTSSLPQTSGRTALFDDSPQTREVPGSLHLASDEHIERMIARTGAVKLVRQFARDLAVRDAEISSLRTRADERERELKRMLRDVQVSNQDIEHRLYSVENPVVDSAQEGSAGPDPNSTSDRPRDRSTSIDGKVNQAMEDDVGSQIFGEGDAAKDDLQATVRPHRNEGDARSGSSMESTKKKKSFGSTRGWQDYIWGNSTVSRKTSGTSSVISETHEQAEPDATPRASGASSTAANRRKALDDQLFQPPDSNEADGGNTQPNPNGGSDNVSVASHKSTKSASSWTVRLFAGSSAKDKTDSAKSAMPDPKPRSSSQSASNAASGTALAALKRVNGTTGVQSLSTRSSSASSMKGPAKTNPPPVSRRAAGSSTPQNSNNLDATRASRSGSASHGPVEMDAILPMESRPPTLTHIYENCAPGELLTDRFGFIYDQRRNHRQREANVSEVGNPRQVDVETAADAQESRPTTADEAANTDETENRPSALSRWQDYLKIATKPTELLSHTPAAGPIVAVEPADETKSRVSSVSIDKRGTLSVATSTPRPSASTSNIVSNHAEFANNPSEQAPTETPAQQDQEPVKLLLQRLTDLHDTSQRDRTVKWNEFMRKVRAERQKEGEAAATSSAERSMASLTMPEASLADGEVVGIAGLGNKGKVGRAKWREFKGLVLAGVPVEYRAKVWSECSGASALRVPGYYDELVKGSTAAAAATADPAVVAQIDMDVHRTLTDNIFFRKGPGVMKLKEVLLAYSRRNPEVGYCQGMNLIAGSLLLIMPTAEDAFYILASIIENILPAHYYDHGLLASRADQQVLRLYVAEIVPKLSAHLDELEIELEALTFQWFLSVFTDCLSAEALYRVWDVVFCLSAPNIATTASAVQKQSSAESGNSGGAILSSLGSNSASFTNLASAANTAAPQENDSPNSSGGGGSTFFFQVALALLKLNEQQLLNTCPTPASVYTYLNHQMTNHAISIDGLIQASEALRNVVKREDVVARRAAALKQMTAGSAGRGTASGSASMSETEG